MIGSSNEKRGEGGKDKDKRPNEDNGRKEFSFSFCHVFGVILVIIILSSSSRGVKRRGDPEGVDCFGSITKLAMTMLVP